MSAFAPRANTRRYHPKQHQSERDEDEDINSQITPETTTSNSIMQRFLSPKIDDPGLPLTDVLLAQIVAPSFQTFWISALHAPSPSWLRPLGSYFGEAPELAPRGSLLAPTLIHGAGLAVCWGLGALASQFYERESFTVKESGNILERYGTVCKSSNVFVSPFCAGCMNVKNTIQYSICTISRSFLVSRLVQAGAFATGILIVSTQIDLLLEFNKYVQFGESEETDLRLIVATVELVNDFVFEAVVLSTWRIIHAGFMSDVDNRSRRW